MEPIAGVALQNQLLLLAMLPFAAALLVAALPQRSSALVAGLSMALALVLLAALAPAVIDGAVLRVELDWVPSAGLGLPLRLDGFSWLFAMLVSGIGLLVVTYARGYMAGKDGLARFFALLLGFTGAMQGILLSGNILMLVVFWELTSLFSFLLIGFWHKGAAARDGARTALLVTATGGLCLLLGMLVIGQIAGSYDLDAVLASGARITGHPLYGLALTLVLIGAFTKSAQFPFHFWLPGAMSAPTPVSAFLHSATMVKAGVFLLIRFSPALGGTEAWFLAVTGIGMATMLIGGLIAHFPPRPEGAAGLLHHQPSGPDHRAGGDRQPRRHPGCDLPHREPRDVQGGAVHDGGHGGPPDRHAGHPPPWRAAAHHAADGDAGHHRLGGNGRGAAAEWLFVQGDVLGRIRSLAQRHRSGCGAALSCGRWQRLLGRLFYPLVMAVFFGPAAGPTVEDAVRAGAGNDACRLLCWRQAALRWDWFRC